MYKMFYMNGQHDWFLFLVTGAQSGVLKEVSLLYHCELHLYCGYECAVLQLNLELYINYSIFI